MAAALDIVSNGRLELGIGAGWNEEESGAYGIELGSIKERFDRFEEACEVLTSLLVQGHDDVRRKVLSAQGRSQRAEGSAEAAPAHLHRRQRREAHAEDHRQVRPALEFRRRAAGRVRPQARRAGLALRGHRPGSEGDHACRRTSGWTDDHHDARSASQLQLRDRGGGRAGQGGSWTWRSCTCRRRTRRPCSNRWPRRSRDSGLLTSKVTDGNENITVRQTSRSRGAKSAFAGRFGFARRRNEVARQR